MEPDNETSISIPEREVLALFARGLTIPAIARELGISERTVRRRVRSVCQRLNVATTIEAVVWATRHSRI